MPITTRLSRKLHQTLGQEAAEDLVNWMRQVDVQRSEFRDIIELNFARFDARLAEVRETLRADFGEMRQEMRALEGRMQAGFSAVDAKLEQRTAELMKWSFVFWVGAVGAIALLAGVLR